MRKIAASVGALALSLFPITTANGELPSGYKKWTKPFLHKGTLLIKMVKD
jgi:hypothetical protein